MHTTLPHGKFFGRVVGSARVADFFLNETVYLPGTRIPRHSHENGYFCLVRQGSYTEAYGAKTRSCGPLTFAFHPPGELHSEDFGEVEARSFNIEISRQRLRGLGDGSLNLDKPLVLTSVAGLGLRLYHEFQLMDEVSRLAIEGLILEIIAGAARAAKGKPRTEPPEWLGKVREILQERFAERLALNEIATMVQVHPVHMATMFRRYNHCTVGEYVRQLRIEYSCRELATSRKSLAEIAAAAGYADQSHFCRALRNSLGLSPSEYRRRRLN